ncbi:MAG: nitrous oxide reductase family maturation protein NosD [Promethearchaeota archaeon]
MKKGNIILLLLLLCIVFAFSPITFNNNRKLNVGYSDDIEFDYENVRLSEVSGRIHIDNNWTDAWDAGICTGNGTYSDPYVIEDYVIDGRGSGIGIWVENSNVSFIIRNCTVYNSGVGIQLSNVINSQLINNNCSLTNSYGGIRLSFSNYNNLSGNTANNNDEYGIYLYYCDSNTASGNTANSNDVGIIIQGSDNSIVSGNTANNNTEEGISLLYSDNNMLSGNTVNYNFIGIYLYSSYYNIISGNTLLGNYYCIFEENCEGNIFENNDCGGGDGRIPGFNLLFLLGILSVVVILIKNIKRNY